MSEQPIYRSSIYIEKLDIHKFVGYCEDTLYEALICNITEEKWLVQNIESWSSSYMINGVLELRKYISGQKDLEDDRKEFLKHEGFKEKVDCPQCVTSEADVWRNQSIQQVIIHLNDSHEWTREKIADWLDTLDDQPKFTLKPEEEVKKDVGMDEVDPRRAKEFARVVTLQPSV